MLKHANQVTREDVLGIQQHVLGQSSWVQLIPGRAVAISHVELAKSEQERKVALERCVAAGVGERGVDFVEKLKAFFEAKMVEMEHVSKQVMTDLNVCLYFLCIWAQEVT